MLLKNGWDRNVIDKEGQTPLHVAAGRFNLDTIGKAEVVKTLRAP
jgi:ankyrin repeat protein